MQNHFNIYPLLSFKAPVSPCSTAQFALQKLRSAEQMPRAPRRNSVKSQAHIAVGARAPAGLLPGVIPLEHGEGLEVAPFHALPAGRGTHVAAPPGQALLQGRQAPA